MIIVLDWPNTILNPNVKAHWGKKADQRRSQKADAFYLTRMLGRPVIPPHVRIPIDIFFCAPNNGVHDLDNCLSSIKGGIDGIAEALGVDDRRFRPYFMDFGCRVREGAVVVCLSL